MAAISNYKFTPEAAEALRENIAEINVWFQTLRNQQVNTIGNLSKKELTKMQLTVSLLSEVERKLLTSIEK